MSFYNFRVFSFSAALLLAVLFSRSAFADRTVMLRAGTPANGSNLPCPSMTLLEIGEASPGSYLPRTLILNDQAYSYDMCVRDDQDGCFDVYTSSNKRHHLLYAFGGLVVADSEDFFGAPGCRYKLQSL